LRETIINDAVRVYEKTDATLSVPQEMRTKKISIWGYNMKRLLLILGLVLWVSPIWATTYYMRADGNASKKSSATSCSSASTAMSVSTHNSQTFSPGDVIFLCSNGGDFKSSIIVPSSGSTANAITYTNAAGQKPTIDLSVNVGSSGWTHVGNGVYKKSGSGRILWEDSIPLRAASSNACTDGNWHYTISSNVLYYKPTTGTPASHIVEALWFPTYGIDLRNRSNITIAGLNFNRCGYAICHGQNKSSPVSPIQNIIIRDNTITRTFWGIWSELFSNGIESNVSIYNNQLSYVNSGISAWTGSDNTPGHSQHHTGYLITKNQILHLDSLTDSVMWTDALLKAYYFTDHEGISFQDVQNSTVSFNIITNTFNRDFTSDVHWNRAIYFYLTNGVAKTSGNIVEYNYISGHYFPAMYVSAAVGNAGFDNNIFRYNILNYTGTDSNHSSFSVNFYQGSNPANGTNYFVNNTIFNATAGLAIETNAHNKGSGYGSVGAWIFRNNIIHSRSCANINSEYSQLTFDHNIYNISVKWSWNLNARGLTFTDWRSKGFDREGSMAADPLLNNPGKGDFTLQSSSPAIDTGANLGTQFENGLHPASIWPNNVQIGNQNNLGSGWEIGAYEYIGNAEPRSPKKRIVK
jgi:hypothetical protein